MSLNNEMENPQLDQTADEDTTKGSLKQQYNATTAATQLTTEGSLREPLLKPREALLSDRGEYDDGAAAEPSMYAVFKATLAYTLRQVWVDKRNSCIGCSIITFTVCIASFVYLFYENSSQLFYFLSQETWGDTDIMVTTRAKSFAQAHPYAGSRYDQTLKTKDEFQDMSSLNLYGLDPFTVEGPPMENVTDARAGEKKAKRRPPMNQLQLKTPLVNTTLIAGLIEEQGLWVDGHYKTVRDAIQVAGVYPRWMLKTTVSRVVWIDKKGHSLDPDSPAFGEAGLGPEDLKKQELRSIGSILNIGDSKKEVELKVADGFPNMTLADDEIMIPESFAEYFGFKQSPTEAFDQNKSQVVNMTADFSGFVSDPDGSGENSHGGRTRGERLVATLGLERTATLGQSMETVPALGQLWNSKELR